jgi:DoxX-like protein
MFAVYVVVTLAAVAANTYAAAVDITEAEWVVANMTRLGVPQTWLFSLGVVKAAGALGLLMGIWIPAIGVAAGVGLVLYFLGALATVVRARWFAHYYAAVWLALAATSLALRVASA